MSVLLRSKLTFKMRLLRTNRSMISIRVGLKCLLFPTSSLLMRRETSRGSLIRFDSRDKLWKLKFKSLSLRTRWLLTTWVTFRTRRKRPWFSMTARSWRLKSSETPFMLKLIVSMVLRIESTSLKCRWKSVRKKFKFTKISLLLNQRLLKKRDIRLQLSCSIERLESRTLELSMRDLSRGTNQAQVRRKPLVSILKLTTSSKLLRKRKNFKDTVMNLTES